MPDVRTLAVIGAGVLGRGIARRAALAGYDVVLEDVLPTTLARAGDEIRDSLNAVVPREEAERAFRRISYAGTVEEAARKSDLVIEAVPDEIESKLEIMTLLDRVSRPDTVLISSTAYVMVTETASITFRAQNCVGMHFEVPVDGMRWIEIIPGQQTSPAAVDAAVEVARRMKLYPVVTREVPGLIAGRMRSAMVNEAFLLLAEGVASAEEIDEALRLEYRAEAGPFRTADRIGLDRQLHVLEHLHRTLGERFRPAPLLREYVRAGRLGLKTGHGVFRYPQPAGTSAP